MTQAVRRRPKDAAAAARKRAYRARVNAGRAVAPVEFDDVWLPEALVTVRLLDAADTDDRRKIGAAIGELLERLDWVSVAAGRVPPRCR